MTTYSGGVYDGTIVITSANNPVLVSDEEVEAGGGLENGANGVQSSFSGATLTLSGNYSFIEGAQSDSGSASMPGGTGVDFTASGTINIDFGTTVFGGGGDYADVDGTLIATPGGVGISMSGGGTLNFSDGATIKGGSGVAGGGIGIDITGSTYTKVVNSGITTGGSTTLATGGVGVAIDGHAYLHNEDGVISGGYGVHGGTGLTLTGLSSTSLATVLNEYDIALGGGYGNGFQLDISSEIKGGYGTAGAAGGTGAIIGNFGTLTNAGLTVGGDGTESTRSGGTGVYTGGTGAEVDAGGTLINSGHLYGGRGRFGYYSGGTQIPGVGLYLNGGSVTNTGIISGGVDNGVTYKTVGAMGDSVKFGPTSGSTLILEKGNGKYDVKTGGILQGDITGFGVHDAIEISGALPGSITHSGSLTAGTYMVTTPQDGTLDFSGKYASGDHFSFTSIEIGTVASTKISLVACYRRGTRIRTHSGEAGIETLRIGDEVMTRSGVTRPIRWIGRRRYSAAQVANNHELLPIRICAGAMGQDLPHRDLWVSP